MWIRSQDKRQVLQVSGLGLSKVFGGKKKGTIIAFMNSSSVLDSSNSIVAQYETVEDALAELNRFEEHLEESTNSVFKLR